MDVDRAYCETCFCGKSFSLPGTYTHHKRNCTKTKKRLAEVLMKAKEKWTARKRRRLETSGETVCVVLILFVSRRLITLAANKPARRSKCLSPALAVLADCCIGALPYIQSSFNPHIKYSHLATTATTCWETAENEPSTTCAL